MTRLADLDGHDASAARTQPDRFREESARGGRSIDIAIALAVSAILGTWGRIGPWEGRLPGDLGDTRFNMVVLEHLHLWSRGDVGLLDGLFFWPSDDVMLYSDTHVGSSWAYLTPRLLGVGIANSFAIWYFLGLVLSGVAAYAVARRWWLNPAHSVVVAGVFLLAYPVTMQAGHAQLIHRWYVPWALLAATRFGATLFSDRERLLNSGRALSGWLAVGFLCSPGLALLLGLLCVTALTGAAVFVGLSRDRNQTIELLCGREPRLSNLRQPPQWLGRRSRDAQFGLRPPRFVERCGVEGLRWISWSAVVSLAGWVGMAYKSHASRFGLTRSTAETLLYSPSLGSIFEAPTSQWWRGLSDAAPSVALFERGFMFGAAVQVLAISALLARTTRNPVNRLSAFVVAVGALLVVRVGDFSVFVLLARVIPAFESIRTPGRIALALVFPIAILCGCGLSCLHAKFPKGVWLTVLVLLFFELGSQQLPSSPTLGFMVGAKALEPELRMAVDDLEASAFLLLDVGGVPLSTTDTEAMLAAYQTGIPTVNGYSGFSPYDQRALSTCAEAQAWLVGQPELLGQSVYVVGAKCGVIRP